MAVSRNQKSAQGALDKLGNFGLHTNGNQYTQFNLGRMFALSGFVGGNYENISGLTAERGIIFRSTQELFNSLPISAEALNSVIISEGLETILRK